METDHRLIGQWLSALGDDDFWGWVLTSGYAVVFVLALFAVKRLKATGRPRVRLFWQLLAVVVGFLGLNKQLDFQTLFLLEAPVWDGLLRQFGIVRGRGHGYFVEFWVFMIVLGGSVLLLFTLVWLLRKVLSRVWLELAGLAVLATFVVLRMIEIYTAGWLRFSGMVWAHPHAVEGLGIALLGVAAWRWSRDGLSRQGRTDR